MYEPRRRRYNRDSVAIGRYAGEESDTEYTVSAGRRAGYQNQAQYAIAVGDRAGEETQQLAAIAVGARAGNTSQSQGAIAIGQFSGEISQGQNTIAIGEKAGNATQNQRAIAIGTNAGETTQSQQSIAIGSSAGNATQKEFSIAIGAEAGKISQGKYAIAIGTKAGLENQPDYSIVISSSESDVKAKKKGLYIDPIRKFDDRINRPIQVKEGNILSYNDLNGTANETKEVVTGFPRLPSYPNDNEVLLAFTAARVAGSTPLGAEDNGTLYFDSTKKRVKVWIDNKWYMLLTDKDYDLIRAVITSLPAL